MQSSPLTTSLSGVLTHFSPEATSLLMRGELDGSSMCTRPMLNTGKLLTCTREYGTGLRRTRDANSIISRNEFIPTSHEVRHLRVPGPNGTIVGANSMYIPRSPRSATQMRFPGSRLRSPAISSELDAISAGEIAADCGRSRGGSQNCTKCLIDAWGNGCTSHIKHTWPWEVAIARTRDIPFVNRV